MMDPPDTHPLSELIPVRSLSTVHHPAHHLVPRYDGQSRRRRAAFNLVELRVADPTGQDLQQHLSGAR